LTATGEPTGEIRPSFCRICSNGCPILVHIEDGRAIQVTGDPNGPIHGGYTCHRGRALPELTHSPDRLLHTLKRQPDGGHARVKVDQALDEIADQIKQIIAVHGPRAVALYVGTGMGKSVPAFALADSFMEGIGSSMRFSANTIDQPGKQIAKGLHGYWMAPPQAFDEPEVILWIGLNPLITYTGMPSGDPGRFFKEARRRGTRIIVIDPRRSEVARRAFLHLQCRPGLDVAIIASLLHVIIHEGLYDQGFVAENVTGLETLADAVGPFTPDVVGSLADVDPDDLRLAARTFAAAKRGYAVAGTGPNMGTAQGTLFEYLVLALDTVCGHYLRAGEVVRTPGTLSPIASFKAQAIGPVEAFGFGQALRSRGLADTLGGLPVAALAEEILLPGDGQVRALLVLGGNPVAAWPDQLMTIKAMQSLELLVTIDIRMSQTAELAHYVIAPTTTLEVSGIRGDSPGFYANAYCGYADAVAQYTPPVISRPPGSDLIEDWQFFYGLGSRLGIQLYLKSVAPYRSGPPSAAAGQAIDMDRQPSTDELIEIMTANSRVPLAVVKAHPHGQFFPADPPILVQPKDHGWQSRLDIANPLMIADLKITLAARDDEVTDAEVYDFRLLARRMHQINSSLHTPAVDRGRPYNPAFMHPPRPRATRAQRWRHRRDQFGPRHYPGRRRR
jgi:anaerobic selenocysteine-containing dehydrogenase